MQKHVEGQFRDGPWHLPITGGWLPHDVGINWNWWQHGYDPVYTGGSAMVEACVAAYSQTVAMCPGDQWRTLANGGRERITSSALSRIVRKPNGYLSPSDFLLNATRSLYSHGNTFALALRNERFEISELHLMNARLCHARVAETGEIFYALGGNQIVDRMLAQRGIDRGLLDFIPARDVLHIRLHTREDNPLEGLTPLTAALLDVEAGKAMTAQQYAFYLRQARPSHVLSTDTILTREQVEQIRERWNEQSRGLNSGGTPILTAGLKPHNLSVSAQDAQLAEMLKITGQNVALVYRVPLQILGIGGAPFSSTESLMQSWISTGLGFALNHIEEAFGHLFGLKGWPDEYLEFNTKALMRSAHKERIEGLARGVQGGIYSPNEAREEEGLPAVEFGDEPRVQQQVVPLSAASAIPAAPPSPGSPPAPANDDEVEDDEGADERDLARIIFDKARRHANDRVAV